MNTPTPLEVPTLLRLLFDSSWQAGLLVLVVVGVQRLLRGRLTPAWHHALWWIVLGRLLIPVPPASSWSLFNLLPTPRSHHTLPTGRLPVSSGWQPLLAPFLSAPPVADSSAASVASEAGVTTLTPTQTPPPAVRRAFPAKALGLVWALVAIFLLGRLALQGFWFSRRAQAFMRPAEPEVLALFEECRVRMGVGRHVQLLQGDVVASPAVFGILRPRLLLPQHIAGTYPPDRLRHILLHELAHVRRGDLLVHALTRVLQALHWFNPVLAWAFRRLRADREIASDALALEVAGEQESRAYGLTIVQLLQHWATRPTHPGTVGILEDGRSLERRIRAIAHYRRPSRWAPAAGIVLAALAAASWTSAQPHPPGGEPPPAAAGSKSVEESIRPDADPPRGLGSGTNAVSRGRQRILSSLESIRIPQVGFDRLPLKVVVRQLKEMARTYDPNGTGMNFFIHPELHPSRGQDPQAPPDSATGQTIQPLEPEPVPLGDVLVRVHPPMRDARLIDVLLEVARSADAPILFNVEDYAVVFFMKPPLPGTQATRPVGSNPDPLAGGITWQPWSRGAVEAARAARRPVLVHFTADWCLTCK
jgi:beta-lactamase regulating signal transducer with metallopeptidase domain